MSSKKLFSVALCIGLLQSSIFTLPASSADKNTSSTGIKAIVKLEKDPLININLSDAAVIDVVKALTDQVGYNLIYNGDKTLVQGTIPRIELSNIKLSEALTIILSMKNLSVRKVGKTLIVGSKESLNSVGIDDSIVKRYKISNLKPTEAVNKIKEFYKDESLLPKLIADDPTNSLSIIVRPHEIEYFESILNVIDIPIPQVMIEIKLIELSESDSRRLGFSYGVGQKQFGVAYNNSSEAAPLPIAGLQAQDRGPSTTGLKLSYDALRNFTANFNAEINALVLNNKAKILSNPRVATQNGKMAKFQATETVPVVKTTVTATGATESVEPIPIGETIEVTPLLVDPATGAVTLDLKPIISSRGKEVIVNRNPVPETLIRSVNTTMTLKSGESLVIGGLKRKNTSESSNRLPVLGDIPFLGSLFSTNSWNNAESELIIMVTPYILEEIATGTSDIPKL